MERRNKGQYLENIIKNSGKSIPLGRFGEAEEYADLVALLVSARATYITGASINLDGGLCPVL